MQYVYVALPASVALALISAVAYYIRSQKKK